MKPLERAGIGEMLLGQLLESLATWWWLIAIPLALVILDVSFRG